MWLNANPTLYNEKCAPSYWMVFVIMMNMLRSIRSNESRVGYPAKLPNLISAIWKNGGRAYFWPRNLSISLIRPFSRVRSLRDINIINSNNKYLQLQIYETKIIYPFQFWTLPQLVYIYLVEVKDSTHLNEDIDGSTLSAGTFWISSLFNVDFPFCPLSTGLGAGPTVQNPIWSPPPSSPFRPGQDRPSLYLDTTQPIKVHPSTLDLCGQIVMRSGFQTILVGFPLKKLPTMKTCENLVKEYRLWHKMGDQLALASFHPILYAVHCVQFFWLVCCIFPFLAKKTAL